MAWHSNMTADDFLKENERHREREIIRLRSLGNYYLEEARKLEETQRKSQVARGVRKAPA